MVRRTARWRAPKPEIDHAALFLVEAKKIVLYSALLSAYRASTGVCLRADRSTFAQERLEIAGRQCFEEYLRRGINCTSSALEIAARHARLAYTGHWWSSMLCNGAPADMGPGDEYYFARTVRAVIEHMRDPVPDVAIEPWSERPPRKRAAR